MSQQGLISLLSNENNNLPKFLQHERSASHQPPPNSFENLQLLGLMPPKEKELPTPTSTPTTARKSRRRSNLFIPSSKKEDKLKNSDSLGSGRSIPLKQGYLYKRSSKTLNKEWKKKYVTLCDDGKLTYHPSLHDYMDDVHGKEISLQYVTVKVPGQKPRGSKSIITNSALTKHQVKNGVNNNNNTSSITDGIGMLSLLKDRKTSDKVLLTAYDNLKEPVKASSQSGDESGIALSNSNSQSFLGSDGTNKVDAQTPNVKKRHRRMKSSGVKNDNEDPDGFEFYIVSLDNKQWHFEAANSEERDEWVYIIEQEIFRSLQGNESSKPKSQSSNDVALLMQNIRTQVPGNGFCVDCDSPGEFSVPMTVRVYIHVHYVFQYPSGRVSIWEFYSASSALVFIAIWDLTSRKFARWPWMNGHRGIWRWCYRSAIALRIPSGRATRGVKLSRVSIDTSRRNQPKIHQHLFSVPTSTREEKENWIRRKYEAKEFLPPLNSNISIGQQLIESVVKWDHIKRFMKLRNLLKFESLLF